MSDLKARLEDLKTIVQLVEEKRLLWLGSRESLLQTVERLDRSLRFQRHILEWAPKWVVRVFLREESIDLLRKSPQARLTIDQWIVTEKELEESVRFTLQEISTLNHEKVMSCPELLTDISQLSSNLESFQATILRNETVRDRVAKSLAEAETLAASVSLVVVPPGGGLRKFAEFAFSRRTYSLIFEPTLENLLEEYFAALNEAKLWKARGVALRGYWSFWSAFVAQLPISFLRTVWVLWKAMR